MPTPVFKRILLKLSGDALAAEKGMGIDTAHIHSIAGEIADVHRLGIQIAIVVGGGNFFRGVADQAKDMDRVSAIKWACLQRSSMRWRSRMHWKSRKSTRAYSQPSR